MKLQLLIRSQAGTILLGTSMDGNLEARSLQ